MRKELFAYWLLLSASTSIIGLVFPLYLSSLGVTEKELGIMLGSASLVSLALLVIMFSHSDRAGRKIYLFVFGAFSALSAALFMSFQHYIVYLVAVILLQSCTRSSLVFGKIISIECFSSEKGRTYGFFSASFAAGGLLGSFVAGRMMDLLGFGNTLGAAVFVSIISLLPLLFVGTLSHPKRKAGARKRIMIGFLAQRFLSSSGFSMAFSFAFLLYLRNFFGLSYTTIGLIAALQSLASMAGNSMGRFTDRHDQLKVANSAIVVSALSMFSIYFWSDVWQVTIAIIFVNFLVGIASTTLPHFFDKVANNLGRDIVIIDGGGITLGSGFGSLMAGFIIEKYGYASVFPVSGILQLASAVLLYALFSNPLVTASKGSSGGKEG